MPFVWNIDSIIFIGFLLINLAAGLYYGRGVKNIRDYALGGRNFSTGALVSTIVATWVGGDYLFITMAEVYKTGLHYAIGCLGMVACLFLNAYVFAPKMGEFLGSISVAEAMGNLYGKNIRLISAAAGTIASAGFVAVQFKVFGWILNSFTGLSNDITIILAAAIVVLYSTFGGIRSVAFTDVIQCFTFGALLPVLSIIVWIDVSSHPHFNLFDSLKHPLFNYESFIGLSNPKFWSLLLLFLLFALPDLNPTMFQRAAIGRSVKQVQTAFGISSFLLMLILIGMSWVAFLLFNVDSNLNPSDLVQYILDHYSHTGLRGFVLIGVVALCMSTADSNINSSAVLLTHDFCYPLNIKLKNELFLSKVISLSIGCISIFLASLEYDLLPLVFMTQSFYIPIIDVPLMMAILGFRSSVKSVLIGMGAGLITVFVWRVFFMDATGVDSILPAMVVNFIFFIGSHYILKQPGGWIKTAALSPTSTALKSNNTSRTLISRIKNFSILEFCKYNAPKTDLFYTGFGIFGIMSTICTMYSISDVVAQDKPMLLLICEMMLLISVCFSTYPIWPDSMKKDIIAQVVWNISVFLILIIASTFFLMLSNFSELQLIVFTISLIVVAVLMRSKLASIGMIILGVCLSIQLYKYYYQIDSLSIRIESSSLILYSMLLVSTAIMLFLKPKQDEQELVEEKLYHIDERLEYIDEEIEKATNLRNEFLRNIEHESKTPITGITSMAEVLWFNYDKIPELERRKAVERIARSAESLNSLVSNIVDMAKVSDLGYKIDKEQVNLSDLVRTRFEKCKRSYVNEAENDKRQFILEIEPNLILKCDIYYISQAIDNLIINALQYCKDGKIVIKLEKCGSSYSSESKKKNTQADDSSAILFSVSDEGIGIPKEELYDIFGAFITSSKTRTPSGGRGIGLAFAKKVIDLHSGRIWAESNGKKGALFKFVLPV